jgi:predicted phage baseplate assembly protein
MPLEQEAPQLDTRTYDQIRRQLLLRIPRYAPEWTDWNESDPGVTLIELFAWLSEQLFFEMNRVPERAYIKFLKLLGMELRPAVPSTAYLTFVPQPGADPVGPVPLGAQFAAQPPGGDQVIFETTEGTGLISLPLTDVQVFDGAAFTVVTTANATPGTTFRPFGWQPQVGSALYLGFQQSNPAAQAPIFPSQMNWRVFLPVETPERRQLNCDEVRAAPVPPVELVWEYRPDTTSWRRLQVFDDRSVAFTREGTIKVQGPEKSSPPIETKEGRVPEKRFWLRVRIADKNYPTGKAPVIDFIRPNVVEVQSLATVREETLGESTGLPNQVFTTQRRPVQPDSLKLETEGPEPDREITRWERKDALLASGRDDPHFVLNAPAGEVHFGDGANGLIPVARSLIIARSYQYGGGKAANVDENMINLPLSALPGVESVRNERRAEGGNDEEQLSDFHKTAPLRLRQRNRAVSADDYATLTQEVGGIGKTKALAQFHPDYPDVEVPGVVTVVIVPEADDPAPRPSQALLETVCRYLETRRILGTELHLIEPQYIKITVEARVQVEPYASTDEVRINIIQAINAELDPLGRGKQQVSARASNGTSAAQSGQTASRPASGAADETQGQGRDFGLDLYPTSLFSVIQRVKYVKAVSYLAVSADGQKRNLNEPIEVPPHGLVYGTLDHNITVVPYDEQRGDQ